MSTVRDRSLEVLRRLGLTTIFANPGSTEIAFLGDLPADFELVLGLHEGPVVGMATGYAIGHARPALAVLHTTAGLGNAVGALATARTNRAPLVVLVGQQDRRHLALEPFLAGHLTGLAGSYPVWHAEPARAGDVPGAIQRAFHEARDGRGPAIVVVPMDDWDEELDEEVLAAPVRLEAAAGIAPSQLDELVGLLEGVRSCALVAGAGAADESTWAAVVALAERLACPVFQEAFGSRPGFPQDHPLFAGHLSFARDRLRAQLAPYELVVAVGAPVLRLYPFVPGPLAPAGTRLVLVTDDPAEAHHSAVELALVGPLAPLCAGLAERLKSAGRARGGTATRWAPVPPPPPGPGEVLRAGHVFAALAERLPADVVLVEESPSSRPQLHELLPARTPLGFVSAAMGGLGFGLPAAVGLRMAVGDRPVVALLGDGASLYAVQALWSAARYRTGVLFVVLANGGYAVMDRLVEQAGRKPSWPGFPEVRPAVLAEGFSCPARAVGDYAGLVAVLDEVVPGLAERDEPLLVEVAVEPDPVFAP